MPHFQILSKYYDREIIIDPEETYQLFGVIPGTIVSSKLQGYGLVLGLASVDNSFRLVFHFQDEKTISIFSHCKTWEDHVFGGLEIVETGHKNEFTEYLNNPKFSDILIYV